VSFREERTPQKRQEGGGGRALQIFGSISLFVQVDRNLVFLWGNLKKKNTLCFAYFKPKLGIKKIVILIPK
jgi:hypothetical protein